jgi:heat shock protein HslJ
MSTHVRRVVAMSVSALVVLAACGDESVDPGASVATSVPSPTPPPGTEPSAEPSIELDGREFLSTRSDGFEIVDGSTIRVSFADGMMTASPGCNMLSGGRYTIDGDTISVEPAGMTEMACDVPRMDQDARFVEFLSGPLTITLEADELTLTSSAASITFLDRRVADPDRPLEATSWVVDTIISGEAASSVPGNAVASLTIVDGVAQVEAGCNSGTAPVTVGDGTITFGPLVVTDMACETPVMELEEAVVATLTGDVTYQITASRLTLTNGDVGLGLVAPESTP